MVPSVTAALAGGCRINAGGKRWSAGAETRARATVRPNAATRRARVIPAVAFSRPGLRNPPESRPKVFPTASPHRRSEPAPRPVLPLCRDGSDLRGVASPKAEATRPKPRVIGFGAKRRSAGARGNRGRPHTQPLRGNTRGHRCTVSSHVSGALRLMSSAFALRAVLAREIVDERVLDAIMSVERDRFVPPFTACTRLGELRAVDRRGADDLTAVGRCVDVRTPGASPASSARAALNLARERRQEAQPSLDSALPSGLVPQEPELAVSGVWHAPAGSGGRRQSDARSAPRVRGSAGGPDCGGGALCWDAPCTQTASSSFSSWRSAARSAASRRPPAQAAPPAAVAGWAGRWRLGHFGR